MKRIYKILSLLAAFTALISLTGLSQNAWINEIHYDNISTDADEIIEVVIQNPGNYSLADFAIVLYNGNNGTSYDTKTLDLFTVGAGSGNFTLYYYNYTVNGLSIQNGNAGGTQPDGMALTYQNVVIIDQFLSYEGVFTAMDGPASGIFSDDIGVMEDNPVPAAGVSLQLSGTGTTYSAFAWQPPATATPGQLNNDQSFGGAPLPEPSNYPSAFASSPDNITIILTWTDATGTQLPSKYLVKISDTDNISAPIDGTPVVDDFDLTDGAGAVNVNYGLETCTFYHLSGETQYFFKIYPYTNAGTAINYKTDGTPPATTSTTEPVILSENFESNSFGDWTTFSVTSDEEWYTTNSGGGALGTAYQAQMNGYHADDVSNDWMISPLLNLNNYTLEKLIFYSRYAFSGLNDELSLKYSTNYAGGDPTLATWSDLSFTLPAAANAWVSSGDVDLSGISSTTVNIAFQYLNVDTNTVKRWDVDEIVIIGYGDVPIINITSPDGGDVWEKGSTHDITWNANNTLANVMIELTTDASAGNPTWTTLVASVPADAGQWTWLISPVQTPSEDCQIRITDVAADVFDLSGIFTVTDQISVPQLMITEIMYNPPESDTDSLEFIELFNNGDVVIDLEGYYFSAGVDFTFPAATLMQGEYILVAVDSVIFQDVFGMMAYQFGGSLSNSGEMVSINNNYGMLVDSVRFSDLAPWPAEPDGNGPSLTFCDPGLDNGLGENWSAAVEFAAINAEGDSIFASPGMGCTSWPVANFTSDITIVLTGGSVNFTDESTGNPEEWTWTFDGGSPGSYVGQTPPPIIYNNPGTYNVVLHVSNTAGSSTEEKIGYIAVGNPPVAEFSGIPVNLYEGFTVDYTDLSTGTTDTWLWEFEGGIPATSNIQNPPDILYSAAGQYDVTLTVTNMFGTDVLLKANYIDVIPLGLDEPAESSIRIYPNPNDGNFRLINPFNEEMLVSIYSVYGQLVTEIVIKPGDNSLALTWSSKGIYVIRYSSMNGKIQRTERMMIY